MPASAILHRSPKQPKPDPKAALWAAKLDLQPDRLEQQLDELADVLRAAEDLLWDFGNHLQDKLGFDSAAPAWGVSSMLAIKRAQVERLRDYASLLAK